MVGVCAGSEAGIFYRHMEFLIRCIRPDNEKDALFVEELHEFWGSTTKGEAVGGGGPGGGSFWAMRRAKEYPKARRQYEAGGIAAPSFPRLLNVDDFSVAEGDFQVFVHIDLLRTQIHDLLRLALDRLHLIDGKAKGEGRSGSGGRIAGLADRLLLGTVRLLADSGQFAGHVRVRLRFPREGRVDGACAALRQRR